MKRTTISPERLRALLEADFATSRSPECSICRMASAIPITRPDFISANWRIGIPAPCRHGCDERIVEVAARFWTRHDLPDACVEQQAVPALRKRARYR